MWESEHQKLGGNKDVIHFSAQDVHVEKHLLSEFHFLGFVARWPWISLGEKCLLSNVKNMENWAPASLLVDM